MKKLITTTFLLFFGWTLGFSQAYAPFPTDSTVWRESWSTGDSGYTSNYGTTFYSLFGDTIIDGKEYNKLYKAGRPFVTQSITGQPRLEGFIREEQKVIYYYRANQFYGTEVVLYNFNLEIGDTMFWNVLEFGYGDEFGIVTQIDSIQIATGEYRKHYFYNSEWAMEEGVNAIEGIGSTYGLLVPNYSGVTLDFESTLLCLATPDNLIYSGTISWPPYNYNLEQCLEVPVSTEKVLKNSLEVFPNPTSHIINLSKTIYQARVEVFSATGQKVLSTNDFTGSAIDLKDLPSGLYLLVISGDEEYVGKIIKNR